MKVPNVNIQHSKEPNIKSEGMEDMGLGMEGGDLQGSYEWLVRYLNNDIN